MGLIQIWRMLLARRYLILTAIVLGTIAGLVFAKSMPRQYQAKSRLILTVLKPDPVTGEAVPPRALEAFVQTQTEQIRDFRVTNAVVDAFGWAQSPQLRYAYARRSGDRDVDFRHWLAAKVSNSTLAYLIPNSPILEIQYSSTSAETARRGAEAVREAFVEQTIAMRREVAARNANWFAQQTEKLKSQLAAAEARKSKFEQANNIILQDNNTDTETAKLQAMAMSSAMPAAPSISVGAAAASASASQLASLDAQLASARQTLGPNHPDILAMQRQRAALAAAAGREVAAARAASRPAAAGPSADSLLSAQTRKVLAQRGLVGEAQRLAGDVTVLRDQVQKTAQRAADFQLQAQSTESGLDMLGSAVTPQRPVSLAIWLYVVAGLGGGAIAGLVLALLLELVFRRVRGVEDLGMEGVPVIGEMNSNRLTPDETYKFLRRLFARRATQREAMA